MFNSVLKLVFKTVSNIVSNISNNNESALINIQNFSKVRQNVHQGILKYTLILSQQN